MNFELNFFDINIDIIISILTDNVKFFTTADFYIYRELKQNKNDNRKQFHVEK
jgi:hypothetical protein